MKLTKRQKMLMVGSLLLYAAVPFLLDYVGVVLGITAGLISLLLLILTFFHTDFINCKCKNRTYSKEEDLWICDNCGSRYIKRN